MEKGASGSSSSSNSSSRKRPVLEKDDDREVCEAWLIVGVQQDQHNFAAKSSPSIAGSTHKSIYKQERHIKHERQA
ncbi:hypothetical protein AVEN_55730-1 [Araneus ventricosus]|uniref:Uncharacterized protein n=1 Tax=Araneus ventricosus TaxID=182803 RepID=A0A4Y2QFX9_ARAVE|nr:hypothetical protein AVEN_55730-1 [Araneus ventricosus]